MNNFVEQVVTPSGWRDLGNVITVADVAWAAAEFADAAVKAIPSTTVIRAEIPHGAANVELRFYGTAAAGEISIINIYGKRDHDGYYQLLVTLKLYMCTAQKGAATELWVGTIENTVDCTPSKSGGVLYGGDNEIGRYYFKPGGYKDLAIIATTRGSTNVGAEIAGYAA